MPTVEICFSPALFPLIVKKETAITVVIDVLRATTSFCTAFTYGVKAIIPLGSLELAHEFKKQGHLVAAERDGIKPDFADFSNSAFDFMTPAIEGKSIYYTTTNGTAAINLAAKSGRVAIAAFINAYAMSKWLIDQNQDIILLCAGWKNNFCIEDTLCAAAIAEIIMVNPEYRAKGDSIMAALLLWANCNRNPEPLIIRSEHYLRLKRLGMEQILTYSLQTGSSNAIPVLENNIIVNLAL